MHGKCASPRKVVRVRQRRRQVHHRRDADRRDRPPRARDGTGHARMAGRHRGDLPCRQPEAPRVPCMAETDSHTKGDGPRRDRRPKLTIVIGTNGAGKSTWCSKHEDELPTAFYDADSIANSLGDWNDPRDQIQAARRINGAIRGHLARRESFGFESTYSGRSRPRMVERAARAGYDVHAVFIGTILVVKRCRPRERPRRSSTRHLGEGGRCTSRALLPGAHGSNIVAASGSLFQAIRSDGSSAAAPALRNRATA